MRKAGVVVFISVCVSLLTTMANAQPGQNAKPWVFWYWMQASVSKAGITADLEAMKANGIGGAYLMPIKGAANPPVFTPVAEQLSPYWWELVKFALSEAKRLNLKIGMHVSDGFALAGGPWITPELSMQKLVFAQLNIKGGSAGKITLPRPKANENFYRDVAVFAYPSPEGTGLTTRTIVPKITTSTGADASFLVVEGNKKAFASADPCWIQYEFEKPFTCRTITIRIGGNNYQANRLKIEAGDDGQTFRPLGRLEPPRHGWQDTDADYTHVIVPATARYFRFIYDRTGAEPGSEDLDAAKWKPSFKLVNIELGSEPRIEQYEAKNGEIWRVAGRTTAQQVPEAQCIPRNRIVNITAKLKADGSLDWQVPAGESWTIMRMGHTSTGHTNATGGAGKGLECDKFNPDAVKLQFDKWYGEALRQAGPDLAQTLSVFHVDSWECGSQNWSADFAQEFKSRRGYDLLPYLLVMAGVPVQSADQSESVLRDVRQTIAELVVDKFYKTLAGLAKAKGVAFSAEAIAPTMVSDGLAHYKLVDLPMGEFWLNSPSHDKPNDMLDAISGAHIYGKNIIQAEAFTTVRMDWAEYPGMMKTVQDRNYALGINKLVYHVFTHNPWTDRKPGMTLDGVGLYFQRDQTWWKQGKTWVDYATRCQTLLQKGKPVVDIAVFIGDEKPGRAVLPDRLVETLPGLFGPETYAAERRRLENAGEPTRQRPAGVTIAANMADIQDWSDPLHGYAYDSFNSDVLLNATVSDKKVIFPGGGSYGILVIPGKTLMNPNNVIDSKCLVKIRELINAGATVIVSDSNATGKPDAGIVSDMIFELYADNASKVLVKKVGKGAVTYAPYIAPSFSRLGVSADIDYVEASSRRPKGIAWNHRKDGTTDTYFISNQLDSLRTLDFSFRITGKVPEFYDAVTNHTTTVRSWKSEGGATAIRIRLEPNASLFVIFKPGTKTVTSVRTGKNWTEYVSMKAIREPWKVSFDPSFGGPKQPVNFASLTDWASNPDSLIRYYSGTAKYTTTFTANPVKGKPTYLDLGKVANLAEIKVNGVPFGVLWTPPFRVDISRAIRNGNNTLEIEITNTWANRLIGDHNLPENKRLTQTTAPFRLQGKPLHEAGLLGPVTLQTTK